MSCSRAIAIDIGYRGSHGASCTVTRSARTMYRTAVMQLKRSTAISPGERYHGTGCQAIGQLSNNSELDEATKEQFNMELELGERQEGSGLWTAQVTQDGTVHACSVIRQRHSRGSELTIGRKSSFSWPVTPMTQSQTMAYESITTTHDYDEFTTIAFSSLQWCAIWNAGYGLCSTYF